MRNLKQDTPPWAPPMIPPVKLERATVRFHIAGRDGVIAIESITGTIHDACPRSTNDGDTGEGNGFDNRFAAARNLSWTGHYARSTPSASISIPWQECCSVIVCSGRCWIESGGLSGIWSELPEQRAEILWACCLRVWIAGLKFKDGGKVVLEL